MARHKEAMKAFYNDRDQDRIRDRRNPSMMDVYSDNWTVVFESHDLKKTDSVITSFLGQVKIKTAYQTFHGNSGKDGDGRYYKRGDLHRTTLREYQLVFAPNGNGGWEYRSGESVLEFLGERERLRKSWLHLAVLFGQ